jgi:hypothetical protein
MFSISRSRLTLPSQLVFLVLNALGILVGTIYNSQTPDLYENNSHHKLGWVLAWIMGAQVLISLLSLYTGRVSSENDRVEDERDRLLPVSVEALAEHRRIPGMDQAHDYRWSNDSGQGTERATSSLRSQSLSLTEEQPIPTFNDRRSKIENDDDEKRGFLRDTAVDKYLSKKLPNLMSRRILKSLQCIYDVVDRFILILGFIAITTGAVTFAGIFVRTYTKVYRMPRLTGSVAKESNIQRIGALY